MAPKVTDQQAWEAYQGGATWVEVARVMHFANGSVARRAAMRHASRIGESPSRGDTATTVKADDEATGRRDDVAPQEPPATLPPSGVDGPLGTMTTGTVLYHREFPRAKFKFVKWNKDGSAQVWGGEAGHAAYRDFRVDAITLAPLDDLESIATYAKRNLFVETSVDDLVARLGVSRANARKMISGRPDIFRRIGVNRYEIRDPEADRSADKKKAS